MIARAKGRVRAQASYGNITVLSHLKAQFTANSDPPGTLMTNQKSTCQPLAEKVSISALAHPRPNRAHVDWKEA